MKWGVFDGQMSQGNGKTCVARLQDNTAALGMFYLIFLSMLAFISLIVDIPQFTYIQRSVMRLVSIWH